MQGKLEPAQLEAPARAALEEAAFKLVKDAHAGGARPGAYYGAYLHWLQRGLPVAQAYVERSGIHARALCFLQAPSLTAATSLPFPRQACSATYQDGDDWHRTMLQHLMINHMSPFTGRC